MKVAFLIINYNDYETTKKILYNIKDFKIIDKIVVVDNNSTDNSFENILSIKYGNLDVIKNKENKGYGSGINFGSKYIISKLGDCFIIVSNPDIVIYQEKDLKQIIESFDNETAIVAPIVKEHEGFNKGWKVPTPIQDILFNLPYIHRFLRPKLLFYKEEAYIKQLVEVECVSGCFFAIDSRCLIDADYFDENVFLYYEENIMARKLQKIHKKTKINTSVEVFHNHSITIDKNINHIKKYKELKKSQMYFQKKYNHANLLEQLLLWLTNKITLFILCIINFKIIWRR